MSSHAQVSENDWATLAEIDCGQKEYAVLLISNVIVDTSFQITNTAGAVLKELDVKSGLGTIIDLSSFSVHPLNELKASSILRSPKEVGIDFKLACITHYQSSASTKPLLEAVRLWRDGSNLSRVHSLIQLSDALLQFDDVPEIQEWGLRQKFEMLLVLEKHDEVIKLIDQLALPEALSETSSYDKITLIVLWARAKSFYARYDFSNALHAYKSLLSKLDQAKGLPIVWSAYRAEIEGAYGNSMLQVGYQLKDNQLKEDGKLLIESARDFFSKIGDLRSTAQEQSTLATYYWLKSDYQGAENQLLASIENHERAGISRELVDSLNNISILYTWLGKTDDAIKAISRALDIENQYPIDSGKASLLMNLARIYQSLGKYDLAGRQADKARRSYQMVGNGVGEALANLALGRAYREMGRLEEAVEVHQNGLGFFVPDTGQKITRLVEVIMARTELIKDYLALGEFDEAIKSAKAIEILIASTLQSEGSLPEEFSRDRINNLLIQLEIAQVSKNSEKFHEFDKLLSVVFQNQESQQAYPIEKLEHERIRLEQSLISENQSAIKSSAYRAIALIEQVRQQLDTRELGPVWSAKSSQVLDLYVSVVAKAASYSNSNKTWSDLFEFIETQQAVNLRKSRLLSSQIPKGSTNGLAQAALDRVVREEKSAAEAATKETRDHALIRAAEARESYRSITPQPSIEGHQLELENLTISDIQLKMDDHELVIRFFIRDQVSLAYFIRKNEWRVRELPDKKQLGDLSALLLGQLASQSLQAVASSQRASTLFGIEEVDLDEIDKVVVLPDGPVLVFPFGVINVSGDEYGYQPLESRVELVNVYSLSDYYRDIGAKEFSEFANDIAIFADPLFDKNELRQFESEIASLDNYRGWSSSLSRLPWTGKEAENISTVFNEKKVIQALRSDATSEALMSGKMRNSKVLHIASHGYFSEDTPDIVGIATAIGSSKASGFLTLTQMLSKPFPSNLVVISGCETSLGESLTSEGLNGLTRGVLAQGAGSVIGTLWPIPDRPTASFMTGFYQLLKKYDGDASKALTMTKRSFMEKGRFKHPYFWSGFVLTSANREYEISVFR